MPNAPLATQPAPSPLIPVPRATPRRASRWPWEWVISASLALLAFAVWQRNPAWAPLALAAGGSAAAAWFVRTIRTPRVWSVLFAVLAVATALVAANETRTIQQASTDFDRWSLKERESRANRVANNVSSIGTRLSDIAARVALDTTLHRQLETDPAFAERRLNVPLESSVESALLVFRYNVLIARTGQTRTVITAAGSPGMLLVDDPFYSTLLVRAVSPDGAVHVVAAALISATPPADQFARALTQNASGSGDVARTTVESPDSSRVEQGTTVVVVPNGRQRLARVRTTALSEGESRVALLQRARARTAVPVMLAIVCLLIGSWRRPARSVHRLGVTAVLLLTISLTPLNALSSVSALFDASSYFAPMFGPLSANIVALIMSAALCLAMVFLVLRSGRVVRFTSSRVLAAALVLASAGWGPFLLRDLARGIALPANGVSTLLWISWQLAIALVGATVLFVGVAAGRSVLGTHRGLPPITAPIVALIAAILAPPLWLAPGAWPWWYPLMWVLAIAALALTRRGVALVTGAAIIAGAGATTLTWGATMRERMSLAEHDLARLSAVDENAYRLLARLSNELFAEPRGARTSEGLLRRYAASELAQAGYGARLMRWDSLASPPPVTPLGAATPGTAPPDIPPAAPPSRGTAVAEIPVTDLRLAPVQDSIGAQAALASMARASAQVEIRAVEDGPTTMLVAAIPAPNGSVTTIAVPPRTRLQPTDPLAALTGIAGMRNSEPPYRLSLTPADDAPMRTRMLQWRRRGESMHGDGLAVGGGVTRMVHVEIDLRSVDVLLSRGALLVLLDVAVVMLLWMSSAMADGAFGRWFRVRRTRLGRSYRVRLSGALLGFFIAPAALFAGWSWYRLQDDDRATRELLVREALRAAAGDVRERDLGVVAEATGSPLFMYEAAQLRSASDSLLQALAPLGHLLPASLDNGDFGYDDVFTTRRIRVGLSQALVGFRRLRISGGAEDVVLATPARGDEFGLDQRREDLGIFLLFTAALGALAAAWLSGLAARSLAQPVGALREAALALAAGREPRALGSAPATEFAPVYRAFGLMAHDLSTSRAALEAAQRRTAAVLQHVASGVLAFRTDGGIMIANPRASELLGMRLQEGGTTLDEFSPPVQVVADRCAAFLHSQEEEEAFDHVVGGRQLRGRLTRLPSGAVLTLDDVTELASAQRVLAWGEMARQVAHEIKNPLTPIRLGVQHLRRAFRDGRSDFGTVLDTNVSRVLAEIDHLDEIARAFSRYGMPPDQRAPAVPVDVLNVVQQLLGLEGMGESGVTWGLEPVDASVCFDAMAQRDELKEVVLNVLENARLAHARDVRVALEVETDQVVITVRDDGQGIAPDVMPQVFEPHFSTRSSGSGLGLAISRRLIEGWGGRISLQSWEGDGTAVRIQLRRA